MAYIEKLTDGLNRGQIGLNFENSLWSASARSSGVQKTTIFYANTSTSPVASKETWSEWAARKVKEIKEAVKISKATEAELTRGQGLPYTQVDSSRRFPWIN